MSTAKTSTFRAPSSSKKSLRFKPAIIAAFSIETSRREYQCTAAASRISRANSAGERRKAENTSMGSSSVSVVVATVTHEP